MVDVARVKKMLLKMTADYEKNVELIASEMRAMGVQRDEALFALTDYKYDEESCLLAILSLISTEKFDLNASNDFKYNFIQNAIYEGYSTRFIVRIIEEIFHNHKLKNNFNINHVDEDGDTMLHSAIYADDFNGDVEVLYRTFTKYGFDSSIKDYSKRSIVEAMWFERNRCNKFSQGQINRIEKLCNEKRNSKIVRNIDSLLKDISIDYELNVPILEEGLKNMGYSKEDFLQALFEKKNDDLLVNMAVKSLLFTGEYTPNTLDENGCNFIQKAMYLGYDETFILDMINTCMSDSRVKEKLDVNHIDVDKETILHSAIYSLYKGDITLLTGVLKEYGFDFNLKDAKRRTILDALVYQKSKKRKYTDEDVRKVSEVIKNDKEEDKLKILFSKNDREMDYSRLVTNMVSEISGNLEVDKEIVNEYVCCRKELTYNDLLYVLSVKKLDEKKVVWTIKALLENGADANYTVFKGQDNIVQNFIKYGYSEWTIREIIKNATKSTLKHPLNVNYVNKEGEHILHTAIKWSVYDGSISYLYAVLLDCGFNQDVINFLTLEKEKYPKIEDEDFEAVKELAKDSNSSQKNVSLLPVPQVKETISNEPVKVELKEDVRPRLTHSEIKELEKYGTILNYKNFISEPVACREKEMKALMVALAQDKKSPIIVGESGVGKTALVDELAYLIEYDKVPNFLKNKIVYEVNPGELVAGCQYVGQFEQQLNKMFELAKKYDVILFIDEIHTMYGVGTTEKKSSGMDAHIKHFIDRNNIKLIGTTTEDEYQTFFAHDALKRRFEKIKIEEPSEENLRFILDKVIDDYCLKSGLSFGNESIKSEIVDVLVFATGKSHRVYDDRVNNPDLAISIIDKAFAFAKYHNSKNINKDHFKEAFEFCDRIYQSTCNSAVSRLEEAKENIVRTAKILNVDFNKFRR